MGALAVSVSVCLSRERVTKAVDVLANSSQFVSIEVIEVNVHVPSGPARKSHGQIQMPFNAACNVRDGLWQEFPCLVGCP